MRIAINAPNLIPELSQLLLVFWIKGEFRLWIDDNPRIESSTTEHHGRIDVGISVENTLYATMSASRQKALYELTT